MFSRIALHEAVLKQVLSCRCVYPLGTSDSIRSGSSTLSFGWSLMAFVEALPPKHLVLFDVMLLSIGRIEILIVFQSENVVLVFRSEFQSRAWIDRSLLEKRSRCPAWSALSDSTMLLIHPQDVGQLAGRNGRKPSLGLPKSRVLCYDVKMLQFVRSQLVGCMRRPHFRSKETPMLSRVCCSRLLEESGPNMATYASTACLGMRIVLLCQLEGSIQDCNSESQFDTMASASAVAVADQCSVPSDRLDGGLWSLRMRDAASFSDCRSCRCVWQ